MLTSKTVEEASAANKILAVREENAMVDRVAFHEMQENREEPIWFFRAIIRG